MLRKILGLSILAVLATSCVSKKKYMAIQASNQNLLDQMTALRGDLDKCNSDKSAADSKNATLENSNMHLQERVNELSTTNAALLNNVGNMATLSAQEATNLEKSLQNIREKDLQIRTLRDALDKKDSVTLALVVSLKSSLG